MSVAEIREEPKPSAEDPPAARPPRLRLIHDLDDRIFQVVVRRRSTPVTWFFRFLSRAYDPDVAAMWIGIFLLCEAPFPLIGDRAGVAMIVASVVAGVVKRLVRRSRPRPEHYTVDLPDKFSFPSGHTAVAFGLALSAFGSVPLLAPPLILMAGVVGYARIYSGVHYPIDVAAGAMIGTFVGSIVAVI